MLVFNTPKSVPNLVGAKILSHQEIDDGATLVIFVAFGGAGGFIHLIREVRVRNGACTGWAVNAGATSVDTLLSPVSVNLPSGLDDLWEAVGAGTRAQKLVAAEGHLVSAGLLPAGNVS